MFLKINNVYRNIEDAQIKVIKNLPSKTYILDEDKQGYFLKETEKFIIPEKVYGDRSEQKLEIIKIFENRNKQYKNTGILLSGDQGTGKTIFIKDLALSLLKKDHPTIIVNQCFNDEDFNIFISNTKQPCVIIFDEFEKVFSKEKDDDNKDPQESLLSLLDGTHQSNHLFIFACNDYNKINQFFLNRPSRIYFNIDFLGLNESDIKEYCEDNLTNKEYIEDFYRLHKVVNSFTFDILVEMVNYSNLFNKSPLEGLISLNIDFQSDRYYEVNFEINNKKFIGIYKTRFGILSNKEIKIDFECKEAKVDFCLYFSNEDVLFHKDGFLTIKDIEKNKKIIEHKISNVVLTPEKNNFNVEERLKRLY